MFKDIGLKARNYCFNAKGQENNSFYLSGPYTAKESFIFIHLTYDLRLTTYLVEVKVTSTSANFALDSTSTMPEAVTLIIVVVTAGSLAREILSTVFIQLTTKF